MHNKVADAVSRLSDADNQWTFSMVTEGQYFAHHSGYKEAKIEVDVKPDGCVRFKVIDIGIVRYNNGADFFEFAMPAEHQNEAEEDTFLDEHLISKLNELHGIT